jgi:3-hydroxy-9,10-secoandrosta-1,3,5(10)-triene-9,17-dione monooxygenase
MATIQRPSAAPLTREDAVSRASALLPDLKRRAQETEDNRRVSAETVAAIRSAGLLRLASPDAYGGCGLDIESIAAIEAELGRACGSTAWCYGVWGIHNWATGLFPKEAQDEYYADPDVISSSSYYATDSNVRKVPGGYRITGRWGFSSGCDSASWVTLGGVAPQGIVWFLVPASDYRIDDTWFVAGLKGTGSKDIVVDDAFVPDHRVLEFANAVEGRTDGWELHHRASYRVPLFMALSWAIASPHIGMAQGAIDEFTQQVAGRPGPPGRSPAESVATQLRLAECAVEVEVARMLMRNDIKEVLDRGRTGEPFMPIDRARIRRDESYIAKLCVRATDRIYEAAGGHSLYSDNPLQRFQRDVHAAAQHVSMRWDLSAEVYGRVALGLDPPPGARF